MRAHLGEAWGVHWIRSDHLMWGYHRRTRRGGGRERRHARRSSRCRGGGQSGQPPQNAAKRDDMNVPFVDLQRHHKPIRDQLDAAIGAVMDAGAFAGGPFVASFEREFAAYCGTRFALGVGNGTDALWLALLA